MGSSRAFEVVGAFLIGGAAVSGILAGRLDKQLRQFRLDSHDLWLHVFPLNYSRDLYSPEALPVLRRIWARLGLMFVLGAAGVVFISL